MLRVPPGLGALSEENILLDSGGRVKIADFGIAKLKERRPVFLSRTISSVSLRRSD
jgi:serine/threonine protein kinase